MTSFFAALQFLTLFLWPRRMDYANADVGRSAIFFRDRFAFRLDPGAGKFSACAFASAGLLSVILVTLLAFMTRGLHLDGVGDTFDGLGLAATATVFLASWMTATPVFSVSSRSFRCCFLKSTPLKVWTLTAGGPCW